MTDMKTEALRRYQAAKTAQAFKAQAVEAPCDECEEPVTAASKGDIPFHGHALLYDLPTGDGRMFQGGSVSWDLEAEGVPILWDRQDGDHSGMILGRVDTAADDGVGIFVTGRLFATEDPEAAAAVARVVELIAENSLGWSGSYDDTERTIIIREPEVTSLPDGTQVVKITDADDMMVFTKGRLRHLALVDTPAQPGARPILGPPPALAAAAAIHVFPAAHFERWESRDPVPLQVTEDGRIWGHAAGDGCFRNGGGQCQRYQRDPDAKMSNFHTGTVTLDNGDVIRVGALTAAGLHADVRNSNVNAQRQHHENSSTVYAKVVAFEDRRGRLCISGSMVPGLDPAFSAQVAGLPVSVEKWPVSGIHGLTLVGAHAVPTPALPVLQKV